MPKSTSMLIIITAIFFVVVIVLIIFLIKLKRESKNDFMDNEKLKNDNEALKKAYHELQLATKSLTEKYEAGKEMQEKMEKLAYTDYLTDLPNHAAFMEMIHTVMLTLRNNETIAVMGIDIDDFKQINDILGSTYGEQVLIDVANRLLDVVDENDFIARIGSDEFYILTQNITDLSEYEEKVKRIQRVFNYPYYIATREIFLTVSIGVTIAPKDGKNVKAIVKNINAALFSAKAEGKNRYLYFDESINQKLTEKIEFHSELRKAMEEKQFKIFYQTQVDLKTRKVKGFEALLRWEHPKKGLLKSSKFVFSAEETGLMVQIGKDMMLEACMQMKKWHDMGYHDLKLGINLSLRQFKDEELVQSVIDILEETGLKASSLEFEITESVALDDLSYTVDTIATLHLMGVKIAFDDFGTGYSSFNYLKVIPIDNLKIDKSFISSLTMDRIDKNIIHSFIKLAHDMDMQVIAEGVESEEQAEFLKSVHCDLAQGYLYSKPMLADEIEDVLIHEGK